jgi:hemolysin D
MVAFFALLVAWSCLGKVDVVAIAEGKIIPSTRVKQIQPLEKGVVKSIRVHEGQSVKAGDILMELDRTLTEADRSRIADALQKQEETLTRDKALLALLDSKENTSPTQNLSGLQNHLLLQEWQQYRAQLAALQSQRENRQAEKQVNGEVIRKLQAILPINTQRAQALKPLVERKLVARDQYLSLEETRITQQQDLAAAKAREIQLNAAIQEAEHNIAALSAQVRAQTLSTMADAKHEIENLHQQLTKAEDVANKQVLYAPVDGQVKDLVANTIGGVVGEAQQLMLIVPEDAPLEVEAWLPNKDIGFVREQDAAVIKVHTFPFTKYGTLDATVTRIAEDAVQDEKQARNQGGLLYSMSLLMADNTLWVDGHKEKLLPGMQVTAEIIIGQRRIIDFFLAPLKQGVQESLRER